MKFNKNLLVLSLVAVLGLASCGEQASASDYKTKAQITISNSDSSVENKVIEPKDVTISETFHSIETKRHYNTRCVPSVGDINLLVIPILIPGYTTIDLNGDGVDDKEAVREDIKTTFFGTGEEDNIGYESLSSFYKKSSYEQLNLSGTVTDWFDLSAATSAYTTATDIDIDQAYDVVLKAVNWAKNTLNMDMTDYDNDKDGYIDGVWCVYSCPDYTQNGPRTDNNNYWAYTTWGNQVPGQEGCEYPNVGNPVYNVFGWASYDFMYNAYGKDLLDAHTFIHETGHMLGLSDYYSDSGTYNPIGRIDMMDSNIIDHNSYSKMLLGWTKPYIVSGNATIDLKSMQNKDSLIVISSDATKATNEFDPFGEYMVVELYTNQGLNYRDSRVALEDRPLAMNSDGVRIFHIDNRKFLADTSDVYAVTCEVYKGETIDAKHRIMCPITNSRGTSYMNTIFNLDPYTNLFDEVRMIEANGENSFSNGGYQKDKSLFKEGDSFSMEEYGSKFFINLDSFDSGEKFSSTIKIGEIK